MKLNLEDLKQLSGNIIITECSIQLVFGMGMGGLAEGMGELEPDSGYQGCAIGFDSDSPEEIYEEEQEENDDDYIEVQPGEAVCKKNKK
jgi:hypothetical protein